MLGRLVLIVAIVVTPKCQPQQPGGKHSSIPDRAQPNAAPLYTYDSNCCTTETAKESSKEHHWYAFLEDSNWWLVIVAAATGFAIASQAIHMRRAADTALAQLRSATNRDRAVIKVQPQGMEVIANLGRDYWFLGSEIGVRNVGIGSAYVLSGTAKMKLRFDREKPKYRDGVGDNFKIVDGFVAANTPVGNPEIQKILYTVEGFSVTEQANQIFPGTVVPYISGFIEYRTVGTVFRRNFHYSWRSAGRDGGIKFTILHALSHYPNTAPSDQERICTGEWFKEHEGNDEYEVDPQSPTKSLAKLRNWWNNYLSLVENEEQRYDKRAKPN